MDRAGEHLRQALSRLEKKGLIEVDEQEIRLTKLGDVWRYNVCWEFLSPPEEEK